VEKKVFDLRACAFSERHVRLGVLAAMEQGLPLRDSVVLREAERAANRETPEARGAWEQTASAIAAVVPESTSRIWIEPIECIGEEAHLLLLAAPIGIRTWIERRYMALIDEAVRSTSDFAGARFATISLPERIPA
jgi:hypothetical protein